MKRNYIIALTLMLVLVSCSPPESSYWKWGHIKSPLTGRCYEVATLGYGTQSAVAIGGEIPCREAQL